MVMMPFHTPLNWAPDLEGAIDRQPLRVPPTASLAEAIALISQSHRHLCMLTDDLSHMTPPAREVRASCVLVMQEEELLGIVTERDVVRLTAQSINLMETTVADVMVHPLITLPHQSAQDIFAALFLFRRYRIRHLPVMDEQGHLVGVISHESIRQILRPANLLKFRRVSDVMTTQVVQAPFTVSVLQLAQLMAEHRVSCVVITQRNVENNHYPVGIVTERDIVQFQAVQIDLHKTEALGVMSTPLFLLSPEDSLWMAHQEMQKKRVGRLVVSWNWGQGLGIVTQTSLLRIFDPMEMYGVIENLQQTIQQLENGRSPLISTRSSAGDSVLPQTPTPDHKLLLTLTDIAYKEVKYMLTNLDLLVEERRSKLQFILETLESLSHEISP